MPLEVQFSPKDFLRRRRPEKFSDTRQAFALRLDRPILDNHLSTLTNRNQEKDFERFAIRLARETICPNIRSQTGPSGGGDGKVDAETTPVAEELAFSWVVGYSSQAHRERWAFAFSAMKKWRPKVQSDIRKIGSTGRGYKRAFFISNQLIPDRDRLKLEDELTKECGLQVTIHDRMWILDQVFLGHHEELANEELQMGLCPSQRVELGPLDQERDKQLNEIELRLQERLAAGFLGVKETGASIEAAILAREIERPRIEVEGRHTRAIDFAKRANTLPARIEAVYQYAWSCFWWFEDFPKFHELYQDLESLVISSGHPGGLRRLYTLWSLLSTLGHLHGCNREELDLNGRTQRLSDDLFQKSLDATCPSAALDAQAMLKMMEMQAVLPHIPPSFDREMREILDRSEGLAGFPVEPLIDILLEICGNRVEEPAWDAFYEWLIQFAGRREGEIAQARRHLDRAIDLMTARRTCDALVLAGKTLVPFYREEAHEELLDSLYVCAAAYEQLGLLWAARGTLLNATSHMANRFHNDNNVESLRSSYFKRLKWIDLRLGRIAQTLAWHVTQMTLSDQREFPPKITPGEPMPEPQLFDSILGILILRSDIDTLTNMEALPDSLDRLGLFMSSVALHYALGWEDKLPEPLQKETEDFFAKWVGQPAADDLPQKPLNCAQTSQLLTTDILGCRFDVTTDTEPSCLLLAESVLAALESLLATGFRQQVFAIRPVMQLTITAEDGALPVFQSNFDELENGSVTVSVPRFNPHKLQTFQMHALQDALRDLLAHLVARSFQSGDIAGAYEVLFKNEGGFERAIGLTGSFLTLGNVLGDNPPLQIKNWIQERDTKYALRRSEPWYADRLTVLDVEIRDQNADHLTNGKHSGDLRHSAIGNLSLIDPILWDKAGWSGVLYAYPSDGKQCPVMALVFRNARAAESIFSEWQEHLGKEDANELLRVVIIRGINRAKPHSYRVLLGSNPDAALVKKKATHFVMISRIHTLDPETSRNLESFIRAYSDANVFSLGYAIAENPDPAGSLPAFDPNSLFLKRKVEIRQAWTIGEGDIDSPAIFNDDTPHIPEAEMASAPVLKLLAR